MQFTYVIQQCAFPILLTHFSAAIAGIGKVHLLVKSDPRHNIIVNQFQFARMVLRFLSKMSLCHE